jgi:FtsH-binding integral membrane protein
MNISNVSKTLSSVDWSQLASGFNKSISSWSGVILATSVVALTGLGVYRWSKSNSQESDNQEALDFQEIKERVCKAYGYVFAGFALTAATAAAAHIGAISGAMLQHPIVSIPVVVASLASLSATIVINKENVKLKHVAWGVFNLTMGMTLSPLGFLNQQIVAQAAAISLGLGVLLTATSFIAPDKKFLQWEGPLMTALSTISIASCVALFFPGSAFAYGIDKVSLYGGLAVFTALFMGSTQRLINEAETQKENQFDPISSSLGVYLDGLNIFIRTFKILIEKDKANNSQKA